MQPSHAGPLQIAARGPVLVRQTVLLSNNVWWQPSFEGTVMGASGRIVKCNTGENKRLDRMLGGQPSHQLKQ